MRALVIDDSRAVRKILRQFLEEEGFEVHEAADGMEALATVHEVGSFQIALVDWNMPHLSGYDFVKAIRARDHYQGMMLMMVTTETDLERVQSALEAGADEYVMKPFTKEMIKEKLRLLLERTV
jgi:two-component system chemotaxis response regulator CheY